MNFYSVIIGTELLNGRRKDAHFAFLNSELLKRGWEQKASFVIKDEPLFIENIFYLIKSDKNSVMFCFGGIGATPDDYTRQSAANIFTNGIMKINKNAKELIINQFQSDAYPHRINMANLPLNAQLLHNVVNNVPGFYLENRFFFTPGFPSMSQNMIIEALDKLYPKNKPKFRKTLTAQCSENFLIDIMKKIPPHINMSSLPQIKDTKRNVVISIASIDERETIKYFSLFKDFLNKNNVSYLLNDKSH
jgi:molybdopterin-biosynthesis enzyme MoeA-like protein